MKFRLVVLSFIISLFGIGTVRAQWDAQISQYWKIKNYYNPSFVGSEAGIENILLHRIQWVGVKHAPKTFLASFNMPLELFGKKHGVGLLVATEKLGLFSNTTVNLQYAYKFDFKKDRYLNVGLQGALASIDFDAGKIHIPESHFHDPSDPAIPSGGSDKAFDMGLGVSWVTPNYYVGFGVNHLWSPKFEIDKDHSSFIARAYYLTGGYNFSLFHPKLEFQPSMLVKFDEVVTQVDVTAKAEYNKMFSGGISWRRDDGFIFLLGLRIKNLDFGYSYDLSTSAISKVSSGSHEIFLRYIFPLKKKKPLRKYKSVRIL